MIKKLIFQCLIRLKQVLIQSRLSFVAKYIYNCIISIEIFSQKLYSLLYSVKSCQDVSKVTSVIKTFERPKELKRLIRSIKRYYPNMKIIVVDDSANPVQIEEVEMIHLPFDSGISAGRQKGLDCVQTEYMLLLEDDYIFYHKTKIHLALEAMEAQPDIDLMGGAVLELPLFHEIDYRQANLFPTESLATKPAGTIIGKYPVLDKVANFYIARTDKLRLVGWNPSIKRLDHADFFTRAKGILTTVYNSSFKCLHAKTPFKENYMRFRNDTEEDKRILNEKWYTCPPKRP